MHELSVTQSILDLALQHATDESANKITNIYLVIGDFSSIVDESVQFYWNIISKGTIAESAKLHFQRVKPKLVCLDCNYTYTPTGEDLSCPECGGIHVKIIEGNEFFLQAIDIE